MKANKKLRPRKYGPRKWQLNQLKEEKKNCGERQIEICVNRQRCNFLIIAHHSPFHSLAVTCATWDWKPVRCLSGASTAFKLLHLSARRWASVLFVTLAFHVFISSVERRQSFASGGDCVVRCPVVQSRIVELNARPRDASNHMPFTELLFRSQISAQPPRVHNRRGCVEWDRRGAKCDAKQRNWSGEVVCTNSVTKLVFKIRPLLIDLKQKKIKYIIAHSVRASGRAIRRSSRFVAPLAEF